MLLDADEFSDDIDDEELIAIANLKEKPWSAKSEGKSSPVDESPVGTTASRGPTSFGGSNPSVKSSPSQFGSLVLNTVMPSSSPVGSLQASSSQEVPRTHHSLNYLNTHSYLYPSNLEIRDYQVNIVHQALFTNVLCALPTGLGKTFIASTVMFNWYRWTTTAKIIFMAPTRPLVAQQIEACLGITGLPRHDASVLVSDGPLTPAAREEEWKTKRVFFATPQTVQNDLKSGKLDPKSIVCLVIDEAHRATGNHAYVDVVNFISRLNDSFRILALTATPSGKVEGVQEVIKNLKISRAEIRTETSIDIQKYVFKRNINRVKVEETDDQKIILGHLGDAVAPLLLEMNQTKVYYVTDPQNITQFGVLKALKDFNGSLAGRSQSPLVFKVRAIMSLLIKMGHAIHLLKIHGIRQFYEYMEAMKTEALTGNNGKKKKPGKYFAQLLASEGFISCLETCKSLISGGRGNSSQVYYLGHPKLEEMVDIVNDFFLKESRKDSRAIIFAEYRESAAEIVRVLEYYCPVAKANLFIGQAASGREKDVEATDKDKTSHEKMKVGGMRQKEQCRVVEAFKSGELNTLVATSIGEEGLDIGQVDLIICYDQSKSPIRILQRMGRTGRKREGNIYMLMTKQEESKIDHALDGYKFIQKELNKNTRFEYSPKNRILPAVLKPTREDVLIEIPPENEELLKSGNVDKQVEESISKVVKGKKKKVLAKKFFMPDNAITRFVSAGELSDREVIDLDSMPTGNIGHRFDLKRSHECDNEMQQREKSFLNKRVKEKVNATESTEFIDNEFYV